MSPIVYVFIGFLSGVAITLAACASEQKKSMKGVPVKNDESSDDKLHSERIDQ